MPPTELEEESEEEENDEGEESKDDAVKDEAFMAEMEAEFDKAIKENPDEMQTIPMELDPMTTDSWWRIEEQQKLQNEEQDIPATQPDSPGKKPDMETLKDETEVKAEAEVREEVKAEAVPTKRRKMKDEPKEVIKTEQKTESLNEEKEIPFVQDLVSDEEEKKAGESRGAFKDTID